MSALPIALFFAVCFPVIIALEVLPLIGVAQQLMVVLAWGFFFLALEKESVKQGKLAIASQCLVGSAVLLGSFAFVQSNRLSGSLDQGLLGGFAILGFALVHWRAAARAETLDAWADAFFGAFVCAGLINALVILIQVFAPELADDMWVAQGFQIGYGSGNLRQPNLSALLELWAAVSLSALHAKGRLSLRLVLPALLVLLTALVLTASRMGLLACLVLGVWAILDRSLHIGVRKGLWISSLLLLAVWAAFSIWTHLKAEELLLTQKVLLGSSSGRTQLWRDVLLLVKENWLWGVGWGEFNFVWTLTPKTGLQSHYFDNAHNLILHLALEMGVPFALFFTAGFGAILWKARLNIRASHGAAAISKQAAFLMLLVIGWHSLFEYPLWRMYFLMPVAILAAMVLKSPGSQETTVQPVRSLNYLAGCILVVAALFGALQYKVTADLQTLAKNRGSPEWLEQLKSARNSLLFSWVGYRATALDMKNDSMGVRVAEYAAHGAIDVALLVAWADALRAAGDLDRARFIAARIAEFAKPESERFLAVCRETGALSAEQSEDQRFRCQAPAVPLSFRDFR